MYINDMMCACFHKIDPGVRYYLLFIASVRRGYPKTGLYVFRDLSQRQCFNIEYRGLFPGCIGIVIPMSHSVQHSKSPVVSMMLLLLLRYI